MRTANKRKTTKKRQFARRRPQGAPRMQYTLPARAVLPDLSDDDVFREQLAQAVRRERNSRWSNMRHFLHQLFS